MRGTHRAWALRVLAVAFVVAGGWSAWRFSHQNPDEACPTDVNAVGGSLDAAASFAEAESLRQQYERHASRQAIRRYCDARKAWSRQEDWERAAKASERLGETFLQLGALREALQSYLEALSLSRRTGDRLLESEIRSDLGFTQAVLGHSDEMLQAASMQCDQALALGRGAGGVREEAKALNCSGEIEYHRGNLWKALDLYRLAEPLWRRASDPLGQAEMLFYAGTTYSDLSQFDEALASYQGALSLWVSAGDKRGEAMTFVALGRLKHRQGEYQEALNYFRQALDRLESIGDAIWEASGIAGVGAVYFDMGDGARATSYWERALESYQKAGLHTATLDLLLAVGQAHLSLDDPASALRRFREAFELAQDIGSERWQSYSLRFMGMAYQLRGEPKESVRYLERSLALQQSVGDPRLEASVMSELGNAYDLLHESERALEHFRRALELSRASGDRLGEATALFGLARASRQGNDLEGARTFVEQALNIAESLRTEVASRELRTSYFASIYRYHELRIDLLMRLHQAHLGDGLAALAFRASEQARARSLLESLAEADVDIRSGIDPDLLEREKSLKRQLDEAEERGALRRNVEGAEAAAATGEIQDLEAQYDLLQAEIRSKSPRYAALTQPRPLALEEVQSQVLDKETLLLEYSLGEDRSFLWAISSDDSESHELPPRAEIEQATESIYGLLTARARVGGESLQARNRRIAEADARYWESAARLSEVLLGPVASKIVGKRILVVADGALQYLPFGALPIPGREGDAVPMIAEHEIVSLPSASALAMLRQEARGRGTRPGTVAVFADPVFAIDDSRLGARKDAGNPGETRRATLSGFESGEVRALRDVGILRGDERSIPRLAATRREAEAILTSAPEGTTLRALDFDASRSNAMSPELGRYRIVHFATHGVFSSESPMSSGLILSMVDPEGAARDGFLRLTDIYNLNLPVDLVVLSACNTALGKQIRGEGLVGIVRAFMYAGATRVVASLWKVEDEATAELMSRFYQEMFGATPSPSAALRRAQLAIWSQEKWRSPFYWGAFVLQGEWGS